jgi:hypothetical protein
MACLCAEARLSQTAPEDGLSVRRSTAVTDRSRRRLVCAQKHGCHRPLQKHGCHRPLHICYNGWPIIHVLSLSLQFRWKKVMWRWWPALHCRELNITPAGPSARIVNVLGTDLQRHLSFTLSVRYMWVIVQPCPILNTVEGVSSSRWPLGLRRKSAAVGITGSNFDWGMDVCFECCVLYR